MPTFITAVRYDGDVYCREHLPSGVSVDSEDVAPAWADLTTDDLPTCGVCGREHDLTEWQVVNA